ncbi:unnamed protein product [Protopolystoma xenopodis]|uniref:Uncharacterized protein n=1 Tax=Protopolystoma xenopodis TaxID=117903 RepID=A0A3S5B6D7_9PLAT|nr:unnamed protein product [Protopolystoma xenopodis]
MVVSTREFDASAHLDIPSRYGYAKNSGFADLLAISLASSFQKIRQIVSRCPGCVVNTTEEGMAKVLTVSYITRTSTCTRPRLLASLRLPVFFDPKEKSKNLTLHYFVVTCRSFVLLKQYSLPQQDLLAAHSADRRCQDVTRREVEPAR